MSRPIPQIVFALAIVLAGTVASAQLRPAVIGDGLRENGGWNRGRGDSSSRDARRAHRERVRRAAAEVARLGAELRDLLENNSELLAAREAVQAARQSYELRRRGLRATLAGRPEYLAMRQRLFAAEDELKQARSLVRPNQREVFDLAHRVLEHRKQVTLFEASVLDADESLVQARYDLQDATTRLADLRAAIEQQIQTDPGLQAARERLRQARGGR